MEDFLNFDDEDDISHTKVSQKRPAYTQRQPAHPASDDYDLPDMDIEPSSSVRPKVNSSVDWSEAQQHSTLSEDSMLETSKRNLMNEYEAAAPTVAPREVSLDDEEAMRILEGIDGKSVNVKKEGVNVKKEGVNVKTEGVNVKTEGVSVDDIDEAELEALLKEDVKPTPPAFRTDTTENEENLVKILNAVKEGDPNDAD